MNSIMLVDDQEIANFIMKKMISVHLGEMEVHDFVVPEKAFKALPDLKPDLILLDLNMPEMDGWAFLDGMKEQEINLPVAILTSSTSDLDKKRSENYSNVVAFYEKPLDPKLVKGLNNLLSK